uniref:DUF4210 domain-containing protein n=1 Tax=Mesocestoides corti TaxID=53468 RepID=A0A5K3EH52_MESCO
MYILRLAIEAFNLADSELTDDCCSNGGRVSGTPIRYPPPPPPLSVDPIIFQFGRKRSSDTTADNEHLFSEKKLCFDTSLDSPSSLLHRVLSGNKDSMMTTRASRLRSLPDMFKTVPRVSACRQTAVRRRVPLNGSFHNEHRSRPVEDFSMSSLTYQWLVTAFWGQMLSTQIWAPPKDEPLDLSCKPSKSPFAATNIFSSMRQLAEPFDFSTSGFDPATRRHNSSYHCSRHTAEPLTRHSNNETPDLPPKLEVLANSAKLFNNMKLIHPGPLNQY